MFGTPSIITQHNVGSFRVCENEQFLEFGWKTYNAHGCNAIFLLNKNVVKFFTKTKA